MANGSRHSLYAVKETEYGVTPVNPELDLVRITGTTLGLSKDSLQSEEIRSDRQIADYRQGANQVGGDINFELSFGTFDKFIQSVLLSGDWVSSADTGVTTLEQTLTGVSRSSGSFLDDGFSEGMTVVLTGFTSGANGIMLVQAVTDSDLALEPLAGQTLAVDAGSGSEQIISSENTKSGQNRSSYTFVRHFADVAAAENPFYIYRGVELNSMQLSISANSMVTGTFSVIGQSQETAQDLNGLGAVTFATPSTTSPLDAFTGGLREGGEVNAVITVISLTLQNGIEPRYVVGSKNSILPSVGRSNLNGQITAFFESSALVNKFINEEDSSIAFDLPDGEGNSLRLIIPRFKYTGGQPDVSDEGPITLSMPFQGLLDPVSGTNLIIERIPKP